MKKRNVKKGAFIFVGLLLVAQLFNPKKNTADLVPATDFITQTQPPKQLATLLKTACYDCHSNHTNYPWYANVFPVSSWINHHIEEGKEHLDFSNWSAYSREKKLHKLEEMQEEVAEKHMPLPWYSTMHSDAKLNDTQIKLLNQWLYALAFKYAPNTQKPQ